MHTPSTTPEGEARLPLARWGVLAVVLAAEVFAVTIRHWWVYLLGKEGAAYSTQVLLAMGVTAAVFAGDRVRRELTALAGLLGRPRFPWRVFAAQLAAYVAFLLLTRGLITDRLSESPEAGVWFALWAASGVAAAVLWCLALLPVRAWRHLARWAWKDLALAAGVGVVAWLAARYTEGLWDQLAAVTLRSVEVCLRVLFSGVTADLDRRVIGTPAFRVTIAPSCSGYEGFGLVAAVVGCYLWVCRDALRFPAALLLLPLGLAASWVFNVLRITALITIGSRGYSGLAVNGFHTQAGWLAFNAVALGVIALSRTSPRFRRDRATPPEAAAAPAPEEARNPLAPYLLPLLAVVGAAMLTAVLSEGDGFDRLYPVRVIVVGLVIETYRRDYTGLGWSWSWVSVGLGLVVFAAWVGLEFLIPPGENTDFAAGFARLPVWEQAVWLVARVVGAVLVVPLAEELAFRGYLLRQFQGLDVHDDVKGRWNWFAVLASSVLFGVLHPDRWVAGTLAGVVYAAAFYRRGRLADAVLAHAVTNAALAAYVLATGSWSLW